MKPTLNKADLELLKVTFATKDDLKAFATKDDLKAFATKRDLVSIEKRIKFTTKQDLMAMEKRIRLTTKQDLEAMEKRFETKFPTKDEINKQFEDLAVIIADSFKSFEVRVSRLEHNITIASL